MNIIYRQSSCINNLIISSNIRLFYIIIITYNRDTCASLKVDYF